MAFPAENSYRLTSRWTSRETHQCEGASSISTPPADKRLRGEELEPDWSHERPSARRSARICGPNANRGARI
jgi:hypothetical protein